MITPQRRLLEHVARLFPDAVFYKPTQQPQVALTFDDVPVPGEPGAGSTGQILDAIATHNCRHPAAPPVAVTFFVITSHLTDGHLLQRMEAEGHEVANHGIADDITALQHPEIFSLQLQESDRILRHHLGHPVRWYRPGRGLYNPPMVATLRRFPDYEPRFALASMVPIDTLPPTAHPRFTRWYVSQFVFPGAILLLHGGSLARSTNTVAVLMQLLEQLRLQGYRVLTLSQLWDADATKNPPADGPEGTNWR